jgi:ABC-type multidrug transport system ATPase subunit
MANLRLLWAAARRDWPPPGLDDALDLAGLGQAVDRKSHQLAEVQLLASHLVVMNHGRLVSSGQLEKLLGAHASLEDAYLNMTEGHDRAAL